MVTRSRAALLALMFAASAISGGEARSQPAGGAPLTVVVNDLHIPGGSVRVDVCTRETFLKENCPYSGAAPAQLGSTSVTIEGVPPGVYAIQAYHDIKNLNHMDTGPFGVPREGIGFSNDAPLGLRGPSFRRAAITHGDAPQTVQITLRHFRRGRSSTNGD